MPQPSRAGGSMFGVWLSAIIASNVQQLVLRSAVSAAAGTPLLLASEHFEHEQAIKTTASFQFCTILRPAFFHQNIEQSVFPSIVNEGHFSSSAGEGRFASVDLRDWADAAVQCFLSPSARTGKTYVLTGELTTEPAIAHMIADATGKPIKYVNLTVEDHKARIAALDLPVAAANDLLVLDQEKREEWVAFLTPDLEQLLCSKGGRTLHQYIGELQREGRIASDK